MSRVIKLVLIYSLTVGAMYIGIFGWLFGFDALFTVVEPFTRPLIFGGIPFLVLSTLVAVGISRTGGHK